MTLDPVLINPLIFRAYDIRGIAMPDMPDSGKTPDLTPETVKMIGKAFGTYLQQKYNGKRVAIGKDNRLTSDTLHAACIDGLRESGCDVIDLGLTTSPMVYFAACTLDVDAAINITASHNPKEYNGVKFVRKNAHAVCGDELQELLKIIQKNAYRTTPKGALSQVDIFEPYMAYCAGIFDLKGLHVVLDAGNGVTAAFAPKIFRACGAKTTELFCTLDGNFPNHEANPEYAKNLQELIHTVPNVKADLGVGFDGDGDRAGIVDEKGNYVIADHIIILLSRDMLSRNKNAKVVFDVKCSQVLIDDIAAKGGIPLISKTGHSFIENRMREEGALLAGEGSGHFFFAEQYFGFDDGLFAGLRVAQIVKNADKPLSALLEDIPHMYTTPEIKAACADEKKFAVVKALTKKFTAEYPCLTIDGVRIDFGDRSWGAIRASNTSPNLTMRFEAPTEEKLKAIMKVMENALAAFPEVHVSW